jgi:hypothetical protein
VGGQRAAGGVGGVTQGRSGRQHGGGWSGGEKESHGEGRSVKREKGSQNPLRLCRVSRASVSSREHK